jgi:type I restriction enzyme S subunit
LPKHWKELPLEVLCSKITDGEHVTPPRTKSGVYLLSARNIHNGKIVLDDVDFISKKTHQKLCNRIRGEEGDILISCSGTIGRICMVPAGIEFSLVRSVAILKLLSTMCPKYVEKILQSRFLQHQIAVSTSQLAQGNLFQGAIKKLLLPVPPLEEQIQIANRISILEDIQIKIKEHVQHSKNLLVQLINTDDSGAYHV